MANIRVTPTDHRAALSLYTGQTARTREDHTRAPSPDAVAQAEANHAANMAAAHRRFLVCRTDTRDGITETRPISRHTSAAAALEAVATLQANDPTGNYSAWEHTDMTGGQPCAAQKKGQPCKASPKQNDQAPITAPHQDSTPAVQEVKP